MRLLALADSQAQEIQRIAEYLSDPAGVDSCLRSLWRIVSDPDNCEFVRAPLLQVELFRDSQNFVGDCDDAATFAAALVKAQGYSCAFIATRPAYSAEYSHVFLRAYVPRAGAIDIDPVTPAQLLPLRSHAEEMHISI